MDKRIMDDLQKIAGMISELLLYVHDCQKREEERAKQQVIRLLPDEDGDMARFKDGSFRRRGNRYEYRFMLDGKQRTVFGETKTECFDKRENAIRAAGLPQTEDKPVTAREVLTLLSSMQSSNGAGSSELFGDWLEKWYATYKVAHLKPHTLRSYRRNIDELKQSHLARIPLNEMTTEHLQAFFDVEPHSNKRSKLVNVIRQALKKAVKLRMLLYNPFDAVEITVHKNNKREAFTFPQQTVIFEHVAGKYAAAAWVMCCTGLRPGEFLGLDYKTDVDYNAQTITVRGGIDIHTGEYQSSPKTGNGRRVIRFLPTLVPHLKCCETENLNYNMLRLHFSRFFKKYGLDDCSLYTFRHTFVSLCAYVGIPPKYIQKLAGHASIVTTFDIYADPLEKGTSPILGYFEELSYLYPKMK